MSSHSFSRTVRAHRSLSRRSLPPLRPVLPARPARAAALLDLAPPRPARTVAGLMQTVIAAVNARGMCAAQAARVAELPPCEVDGIEALCGCAGCQRARAH